MRKTSLASNPRRLLASSEVPTERKPVSGDSPCLTSTEGVDGVGPRALIRPSHASHSASKTTRSAGALKYHQPVKWLLLGGALLLSYAVAVVVTRSSAGSWAGVSAWTTRHPWVNGGLFAMFVFVFSLGYGLWFTAATSSKAPLIAVILTVIVFLLFAWMTKRWAREREQ